MHQPEPFIGFDESIVLAKISLVSGEYLEDAKLYLKIINTYIRCNENIYFNEVHN